jgi:hypothetical protein
LGNVLQRLSSLQKVFHLCSDCLELCRNLGDGGKVRVAYRGG